MTDIPKPNALPNEDDDILGMHHPPHEVTINDLAATKLNAADRARIEERLVQIREEARRTGTVQSAGVRLPGAPFPVADAQHGYYGVPMLKQPRKWEEIEAQRDWAKTRAVPASAQSTKGESA